MLTYHFGVITTRCWVSPPSGWPVDPGAADIEECQMQMVAVKPIARWQIWLGKWLGILLA